MNDAFISAQLKLELKDLASGVGFDACAIAAADELTAEIPRYQNWIEKGMHGGMGYMERNTEKRMDPSKLLEGSRSVILLLHNYQPSAEIEGDYKIARYAYGEDYHFVLKDKMRIITDWLKQKGAAKVRAFTDSAPILERPLAEKAGLGWIGKNSLLLNREMGSYFFIAEILTDLAIEPDKGGMRDYCGGCVKCITACPTGAIVESRVVDARRCISYLTIELKDDIPEDYKGKYENWIFGCDICQEVCPWNSKVKPHNEKRFMPSSDLLNLRGRDWDDMGEEQFNEIFSKSPLSRPGYHGLKRNITFLKSENEIIIK